MQTCMNLCRALGGATSLRIPQWGDVCGSCLMDYVPSVRQLLAAKVLCCCQ